MAHAEFRGANPDSRVLGTGVSIGAHAVLLGLFLFGAAHVPGRQETPTVPIAQVNLEFLNRPGSPGGGGSGGEKTHEPPRRLENPAARPRVISPLPNPSDLPPVPAITIPVATVNAVEMLPGSVTAIGGSALVGRPGPGSGDGDGPGVDRGRRGGFGGETYVDGAVGVTSPRLLKEVKPNYTGDAVRGKVQGAVLLEAVVLPDGSVDPNRVRVVRSLDRGLDQQAVHAVKGWHFRPGTFDGRPVAVVVHVELTFTLR
jgi:protein TonB